MSSADFRYVKGQHLSLMLYERVILSVKRTNSESKGKRLEVGWEARSSYETSLAFLLPSPYPEQVKSEWQCVRKTPKKRAWFNEAEKKYREENFNLMSGLL